MFWANRNRCPVAVLTNPHQARDQKVGREALANLLHDPMKLTPLQALLTESW